MKSSMIERASFETCVGYGSAPAPSAVDPCFGWNDVIAEYFFISLIPVSFGSHGETAVRSSNASTPNDQTSTSKPGPAFVICSGAR